MKGRRSRRRHTQGTAKRLRERIERIAPGMTREQVRAIHYARIKAAGAPDFVAKLGAGRATDPLTKSKKMRLNMGRYGEPIPKRQKAKLMTADGCYHRQRRAPLVWYPSKRNSRFDEV